MAGLSGKFFHLMPHADTQRNTCSRNCSGRFQIAENNEHEESHGFDKGCNKETEEIILPASYVTAIFFSVKP